MGKGEGGILQERHQRPLPLPPEGANLNQTAGGGGGRWKRHRQKARR